MNGKDAVEGKKERQSEGKLDSANRMDGWTEAKVDGVMGERTSGRTYLHCRWTDVQKDGLEEGRTVIVTCMIVLNRKGVYRIVEDRYRVFNVSVMWIHRVQDGLR